MIPFPLSVDIVWTESVVSVPTITVDCPLKVYTCHPKEARSTVMHAPFSSLPDGSLLADLDMSIVFRRGKRFSTAHAISNFVS